MEHQQPLQDSYFGIAGGGGGARGGQVVEMVVADDFPSEPTTPAPLRGQATSSTYGAGDQGNDGGDGFAIWFRCGWHILWRWQLMVVDAVGGDGTSPKGGDGGNGGNALPVI